MVGENWIGHNWKQTHVYVNNESELVIWSFFKTNVAIGRRNHQHVVIHNVRDNQLKHEIC
jgi:hypothetical protein